MSWRQGFTPCPSQDCSNSPAGWRTARWGTQFPTTLSFCSSSESFLEASCRNWFSWKHQAQHPTLPGSTNFYSALGWEIFSSLVIKTHLKEFPPSSRASWFTVAPTWTHVLYFQTLGNEVFVVHRAFSLMLWVCSQQQWLHTQTVREKFSEFAIRYSRNCQITQKPYPSPS